MAGVAMVIMVRGMTESFAGDLQTWTNAYLGGDVYITSSVRLRSDIGKKIQSVDGVYAVAPIRYFEVDWKTPTGETENINFMALDAEAYTRVTNFVFSGKQVDPQQAVKQLARGQNVFISSVLAEKYNLSVGDSISLSIERTREIGMLRAIGTTRGQIVRMVLAEAGLMGVIGGILGIGTGAVLARVLFIGMTTMSGYQLTFILPPESVSISLVMALVVSQIAAIPPAIRAARVRILEAVQYE